MTTAPTSGQSPFQRASLPSSTSFRSFPSTSFNTPSTSSPYVTDQPQSPNRFAYHGDDDDPWTGPGSGAGLGAGASGADKGPKGEHKHDLRGQTLEEMYSAPENTLEIEVRDPRTQGRPTVERRLGPSQWRKRPS